jgi:hypothetical protein
MGAFTAGSMVGDPRDLFASGFGMDYRGIVEERTVEFLAGRKSPKRLTSGPQRQSKRCSKNGHF